MKNRFFAIIGPRRHDLSGLPLGFLFMWRPRDYPLVWQEPVQFQDVTVPGRWVRKAPSRFAPIDCAWQVGFYMPWAPSKKILPFEAYVLLDASTSEEGVTRALQASVDSKMAEHPGARIVRDRTLRGRRHDLSENPLQLARVIEIAA